MSTNKILNVAVVGTGAIGRTHIQRIAEKLHGAKVVACSDANLELSRQVASQYGLVSYDDGEAMIASPDVDAVVVATLDAYHEKYVMASIRAGKYVLCEKPLAPEADACRRIVDAEIATGRQWVQVGFMRRYDPGYRQLKEMIDSREYGEPLIVHCIHRNATAPNFTTAMPVENSMIHEIDVLRWLLNEDYVKAEVVFPRRTRLVGDEMQDPQIMYLTTQSGVRIDIESFVNCQYGYDIKCEVVCEKATLNLPEPANAMIRTHASRVTPICRDWSERFVEAYNVEFQEWIDASLAGSVDGPSAWDGYVGQVTAKAGSRARDLQQPVVIQCEARPDFYSK